MITPLAWLKRKYWRIQKVSDGLEFVSHLTCDEWVRHWGPERLEERMKFSEELGRGQWLTRNQHLWQYPCWELIPGLFWAEDWSRIRRLWKEVGGKSFNGTRIIAAKWDITWEHFAVNFPNGHDRPYPPFAHDSCAHWSEVSADEAIVLGVISEKVLKMNIPPQSPEVSREFQEVWESLTEDEKKETKRYLARNTREKGFAQERARRRRWAEQERKRKEEG
jgi:hypothetical protein